MIEQPPAQITRGLGQPRGVGHGVERARAAIQQGRGDFRGAGGRFARRAGEQLHRSTAQSPLLLAAAQIGFTLGVVGHVQRAFAAQLAINAVFVDEVEHQRWRRPEHAIELTAHGFAKSGFDFVGRDPQPRVDQPHIAPRTTMPGAMRLQHTHAFALFEQMNGG